MTLTSSEELLQLGINMAICIIATKSSIVQFCCIDVAHIIASSGNKYCDR
jgi:hypothetical protein